MTNETTTAPETYRELRARHQREFNDFPFFAAFNQEQFEEGMRKLGVTDTADLYKMGNLGCFYRKTDSARLREMLDRQTREMDAAMRNEDFAVSAFLEELANHEFCITRDPTDALAALGYTFKTKKDAEGWDVADWPATFEGSATLETAYFRALKEYGEQMRRLGY